MLGQKESEQIKKVIRTEIEDDYLAGANLLVIKDGEEVLYHEDGYADKETATPIKRDSIFRLYSATKPVTATAVMMLLERGEIDLYDPVSKYLEGFKNQMVEENDKLVSTNREMIIKDLLSMTSGLTYGGENIAGKETAALFKEIEERLFGDSPLGTVEAMNKLGRCTLSFQPGTYWQYGSSADVLGAIVEVASGKSLGKFLKDEIFKPLNMVDTDFYVPEDKMERLVKAYQTNEKGMLELYHGNNLGINNKMDREPVFESGGAGLVSTIDDYSKFTKMLANNGTLDGVKILKSRTVKYLTTSTLNTYQQKGIESWLTLCGYSYGNLMRVMTDSTKAGDFGYNGEYGWDGWLGVHFCICPNEGIIILFMMQKTNSGTTTLTRKLRNIILSSF